MREAQETLDRELSGREHGTGLHPKALIVGDE